MHIHSFRKIFNEMLGGQRIMKTVFFLQIMKRLIASDSKLHCESMQKSSRI